MKLINKMTLGIFTVVLSICYSCNNDDDINLLIDVPECVAKHIESHKNNLEAVGKFQLNGEDYYNCVRSSKGIVYNHYVIDEECQLYCDFTDTLCMQFFNHAELETSVWIK